jgi:mRNA-degrading endonuclease YafQ of YafQ-DinJ toxin-antitoxin module
MGPHARRIRMEEMDMNGARLSLSRGFAKEAGSLPKEVKAKLVDVFDQLLRDPHHPSLHLKKIKGARRPDVYECRVDISRRLVVRLAGEGGIELVHVGSHDETIERGARLHEPTASYDGLATAEDALTAYLEGDDEAITFVTVSEKEVRDLLAQGDDRLRENRR